MRYVLLFFFVAVPQLLGACAAPAPPTARLFAYYAGTQTDAFLDTNFTFLSSGVTLLTNSPTKYYTGSPVFEYGTNVGTWDLDKNYNTTLKVGSEYWMWYAAVASSTQWFSALAISSDGITWTKPNLGLVSYAGNTTNNILLGQGSFNMGVVNDASGAADRKFVSTMEMRPGDTTGGSLYIYISANGTNWTLFKTNTSALGYIEAKELVKRPDGTWVAYYSFGHGSSDREIGAFVSNTSDLGGTWTDQGSIIPTSASTAQKYSIGVEYVNGIYYGFVGNYNSTSEQIVMDLYVSRDGLAWTLKKAGWIPLGAAASWDDEMILNGKSLIADGNTWRYYYNGFAANHAASIPRDARIGLATIGYERIGGITGSGGTLITTAFQPSTNLTINANITSLLQVEVLDGTTNAILTGFARTDMDAVSGDVYAAPITWAGVQIPTNQTVKVKFYL